MSHVREDGNRAWRPLAFGSLTILTMLCVCIALLLLQLNRMISALYVNQAQVLAVKARVHEGDSERRAIAQYLSQSLRWNAANCQALWHLGKLEAQQGHYADAAVLLEAATNSSCPYNLLAYFDLGNTCARLDRVADAATAWEKAEFWPALSTAGKQALAAGRWEEAERAFAAVVRTAPLRAAGYTWIGAVRAGQGKTTEAIGWWQQAIAVEPADVWAYMMLGDLYQKQGDFEKAQYWYVRGQQANPGSEIPLVFLGIMALKRGMLDGAISYLQRATNMNHDNAPAHAHLALAYVQSGDAKRAIEHAQIAVRLDPANDYYRAVLDEAYQVTGNR